MFSSTPTGAHGTSSVLDLDKDWLVLPSSNVCSESLCIAGIQVALEKAEVLADVAGRTLMLTVWSLRTSAGFPHDKYHPHCFLRTDR